MSDAYVIEVNRKTVGLIVRLPEPEIGYRFFASVHALNGLEGHIFGGPYEAERAARNVFVRKVQKPAPHKSMKRAA